MHISLRKQRFTGTGQNRLPIRKKSIWFLSSFQVYIISLILVWCGIGLGQSQVPKIQFIDNASTVNCCVSWERNTEPDLAGYRLRIFGVPGIDTTYTVQDTCCRFLLHRDFQNDTLLANVVAIDNAGNESEPSETAWFIPRILAVDMQMDDKRRIDIDDLREYIKQYDMFFGKSSWGK